MVGVETGKRNRGPFLALLVMLMILLLIARCGATTSIINDNATSPYHARMDESDWMFDSEISRMLADIEHATGRTTNQNRPVFHCVDPGQKYGSCFNKPNNIHHSQPCAHYTRNCNH